jgi:hypothetical protein
MPETLLAPSPEMGDRLRVQTESITLLRPKSVIDP